MLAIALLAGWAVPAAEAQQFGQWWWVASATASGRQISVRSLGGGASDFTSERLRFRFGLRGFIVHPAIGEFRADLDGSASRVSGARSVDTDQIGFDTRLKLLPYGYFPISLYARRSFFDYGEPAGDSSLTLTYLPDGQQVWGGLISSRWKALRGFKFRFLDSEVDFLDPGLGREITEEQEILWSRHIGAISHTARLSRRYLEYPIGDFAAEDLLLSLEQSGQISTRWYWRQALAGTSRNLPGTQRDSRTETLALSSQLRQDRQNGDQLRLLFNTNAARSPVNRVDRASLTGDYSYHRGGRWTISPSTGYSLTRLDDETISALQASVSAAWNWRRGSRSVTVFNGLGWVTTRSDRTGPSSPTSDALTYELRVAAGVNPRDRLGRHFEVILFRNEIVTTAEIDPESIDFGLVVNRNLFLDSITGRLTLNRTWGRLQASSNTFWTRRESSSTSGTGTAGGPLPPVDPGTGPPRAFQSDNLSQVVQISRAPFDVTATLASSRVSSQTSAEQRADLITSALRWKPYRHLNVSLRYRAEKRDTELAPVRDFERYEAALDFALGFLSLEAGYFETINNSGPVQQRSNRGVHWRITRRAAGLLPIISAPQRRGVIR